MCNMVTIDFNVAKTIVFGLRGSLRRNRMDEIKMWLDKVEEILDNANEIKKGVPCLTGQM